MALTYTGPETLFDVCMEVADVIEAQPTNYYQESWHANTQHLKCVNRHYAEACGTAYCRGGWMINLIEPPTTKESKYRSFSQRAHHILEQAGIPLDDVTDLFAGDAVTNKLCANGNVSRPGESDYVHEGAAGMRAFALKHEAKLRAVHVKDLLNDDGTINTNSSIVKR